MEMVGYTGDIIMDHWWWDNLGIDLNGIIFEKDTFPILEDHETDKKIAWSDVPVVDPEKGLYYTPDKIHFVDTEYSREFRKLSSQGFPYQASVYVIPSVIEFVEQGQEGEVNGRAIKGPGTIFRKCSFQESSVCVFGWDGRTSSVAYSDQPGTELQLSIKGEVPMPKRKKTKFQSVDYSQYTDEASCVAAGGSWNGTACEAPAGQMATDYSQYNDKDSCEAHGGVWDNGACKAPGLADGATDQGKDYSQYTDKASCESAGGRWDGAVCSAPDANQSQDTQFADYSQYNDKAACESAGGVWDNNACKAPSAKLADYSQHNDKESCEAAGGVWDNNACKAPNAVLAELVEKINSLAEPNNSDDITSKTDEASCAAAGGHWYDGACHVNPKPSESDSMSKQIEAKLKKVEDGYEAKLKKIEASYESKFSAAEKKITQLEKENEKAKLLAAQEKADRIWATQLTENEVNPRLHKKIKKGVSYLDFVKHGELDHVAFVKAIEKEIEDWEDVNVVQGTGFGSKSVDDTKFNKDEFDDVADDLLKLAGQGQKKSA